MSFERQSPERYERGDNGPVAKSRAPRTNWLRGGLICIVIGVVNVIYYLQTGKIILGPRGSSTPGFDLLMSVLALICGAIFLGIHFVRSRE